jgi:hypothetical protein
MQIGSLLELTFFDGDDARFESHISRDETIEHGLMFLRLASHCVRFGGSEAEEEAEQFIDDAIKALEQE